MVSLMNDDDDVPQLSAETFSALSEFYKEQEDREKKQEEVRCLIEGGEDIDKWEGVERTSLGIRSRGLDKALKSS